MSSLPLTESLLAVRADARPQDTFGETALHLLARSDPTRSGPIAEALLRAGADPTVTDARGFTALHAAAMADNVDLAKAIATHSPNAASARTPSGETAADVAERYGRPRVADVLLRNGSTLTRKDAWPPLHTAARMDSVARTTELLAVGADVTSTFEGKTAVDVAREYRSRHVEALLMPLVSKP